MNRRFKLGLIINPYSGIGGALALKGSDGADIREKALAMGANKQSGARTKEALELLEPLKSEVEIYCPQGEMGGDIAESLGLATNIIYTAKASQTEDLDTMKAAQALLDEDVDLIIFAGGDGTARNMCEVIQDKCPVIGVPAGCKIHSGVYAITPLAAGRVLAQVVSGELLTLMQAEVKDIDENAFRAGQVIAKTYGNMDVPQELSYMQSVKMGGKESDELVLADIAAEIIEEIDEHPDNYYVMGSGSTVDFIMQELGLENTLLGVDIVKNGQLVARDVNAIQLLEIANKLDDKAALKLVITLIGGQGHVFGRGNQQLSSDLLSLLPKSSIRIVATKTKLTALNGRPLIADTGSKALNRALSGPISVITGYRDKSLYYIE